jgi:hypothetical protein
VKLPANSGQNLVFLDQGRGHLNTNVRGTVGDMLLESSYNIRVYRENRYSSFRGTDRGQVDVEISKINQGLPVLEINLG